MRIVSELATALHEYDHTMTSPALDAECLCVGVIRTCVPRRALTGRKFDLIAEGDRLIGLEPWLSGVETSGAYP